MTVGLVDAQAGSMGDSNSKGKEVSRCGSNPDVEQSVINSSQTKLDPSQDDEGELEVVSKRNKSKPGNTLDDSDEDLACEVLNKDLQMRGASVIRCGENDHAVWPPTVIIMYSTLDKDDKANQELREYYKVYPAITACDSYGPPGHLRMSVLTFESSATGYSEANRLHMDLARKWFDREAWDCSGTGGVSQLYGFLATSQDLDALNQGSLPYVCLEVFI